VVEAERTRVSDIERTRDTLEQLGANLLGVVLNKRRLRVPRFIDRLI
jgi:Mrp family chromosome partitioning ATPase